MDFERERHTVWMSADTWNRVQSNYRTDNCASQSEFIEKAICFYTGYLATEKTGDYLPRVLCSSLEGILNIFGDRIGKLMYKLIVEQSMVMHLIAADTDIDDKTLHSLRGRCVSDVNRTNGQISFRDILRFQRTV